VARPDPRLFFRGDAAARPAAHDHAAWSAWGASYFGRPWLEAPFLWSESYFYRRLLGAVGFFGPGPWRCVDPFEGLKAAELSDPALEPDLADLVLPDSPRAAAGRVHSAMADGTLRLFTHEFCCAPWDYRRMPADLAGEFAQASLTILKGDLNYRPLTGDLAWQPDYAVRWCGGLLPGTGGGAAHAQERRGHRAEPGRTPSSTGTDWIAASSSVQ
jgi:Damage-control phosphatase ARMT1-like domain